MGGPTADGPTRLMVNRSGVGPAGSTPEEIEVSVVSGNNITIVARGLKGTSDTSHPSKGTTVLEVWLSSEDVDSNGSPTIELDVGDDDDDDRYIDGSVIGTTGGIARLGSGVAASAQDGFPYTYTADDTIDIKVVAAAATKVAGTFTLWALLSMEQD